MPDDQTPDTTSAPAPAPAPDAAQTQPQPNIAPQQPGPITRVKVRPDGARVGWNGQQWISLPAVSPQAAAQMLQAAQLRGQGISPQDASQLASQQNPLYPSAAQPGTRPTRPGFTSRVSEVTSGFPTKAGSALGNPDMPTLQTAIPNAINYWKQYPGTALGQTLGAVAKGDVGPIGVFRHPINFFSSQLGIPQAMEDLARQNYSALAGDVAGGILNTLFMWYGGEGAEEKVVGPISSRTLRAIGMGDTEDSMLNKAGYGIREMVKTSMDNLKEANPDLHGNLSGGIAGQILRSSGDRVGAILAEKSERGELGRMVNDLKAYGLDPKEMAYAEGMFRSAARGRKSFGFISSFGLGSVLAYGLGLRIRGASALIGTLIRFGFPAEESFRAFWRASRDPFGTVARGEGVIGGFAKPPVDVNKPTMVPIEFGPNTGKMVPLDFSNSNVNYFTHVSLGSLLNLLDRVSDPQSRADLAEEYRDWIARGVQAGEKFTEEDMREFNKKYPKPPGAKTSAQQGSSGEPNIPPDNTPPFMKPPGTMTAPESTALTDLTTRLRDIDPKERLAYAEGHRQSYRLEYGQKRGDAIVDQALRDVVKPAPQQAPGVTRPVYKPGQPRIFPIR